MQLYYPRILKSKQSKLQEPNKVTENQSNVGSIYSPSKKRENDAYATSYWKAAEELRGSIEQRKKYTIQKQEASDKKVYRSIDDFLTYIRDKGVPIKDNRSKDGCVWVRADVEISDIMAHAEIKGRGFRYSPKCKAFNGEPGWYY